MSADTGPVDERVPRGVNAFLQIAGLVDDQHRTGVAEVVSDVLAQAVADFAVPRPSHC
jgi:hypothetical protein